MQASTPAPITKPLEIGKRSKIAFAMIKAIIKHIKLALWSFFKRFSRVKKRNKSIGMSDQMLTSKLGHPTEPKYKTKAETSKNPIPNAFSFLSPITFL